MIVEEFFKVLAEIVARRNGGNITVKEVKKCN